MSRTRRQRSGSGARTRGRELALKYLYAVDLRGGKSEESLDQFVVHQKETGIAVDFARRLVKGILECRESLDRLLASLATNWSLDRMAALDRNILRMGCYELLREPEIPARVTINEAVELAKRYGTAQSGSFVNGILDRAHRQIESTPPEADPCSES